jgi:hypothetical protein
MDFAERRLPGLLMSLPHFIVILRAGDLVDGD